MTTKETLHQLVDELPEDQAELARQWLEDLRHAADDDGEGTEQRRYDGAGKHQQQQQRHRGREDVGTLGTQVERQEQREQEWHVRRERGCDARVEWFLDAS